MHSGRRQCPSRLRCLLHVAQLLSDRMPPDGRCMQETAAGDGPFDRHSETSERNRIGNISFRSDRASPRRRNFTVPYICHTLVVICVRYQL